MHKTCASPWCNQSFEITPDDLAFYEKVSPVFGGKKYPIPPPTQCPECRQQRRLAFRNERKLYWKKSFFSQKPILTMYAPESTIRSCDQDEWWQDSWDATTYQRPVVLDQSILEQFLLLKKEVPHTSLYTKNVENSYYTNYTLNMRNCYLIFGGGNSEDCLYGKFITLGCRDVVDSLAVFSSELCYEAVASQRCYHCMFVTDCRNCQNCLMCGDCQSCEYCALCFGLANKKYCFLNREIGETAYEERMREFMPLTPKKTERLSAMLRELSGRLPHRASHIVNCENCTGDMIAESRECRACYEIEKCENCRYLSNAPNSLESMDCNFGAPDGVRFCYEVCSSCGTDRSMATFLCWYCSDMYHSMECSACRNCFACIGLKHKQYCILNKQYTKEEYERLVPKIIEKMMATPLRSHDGSFAGYEWGEFFPVSMSPFAYNETVAQEYFPLTKEEVLKRGWKWRDEVDEIPKVEKIIPAEGLPDSIDDIPDDILNWAIKCEVTGRPFRIVKQELQFYRKMRLPIPRFHPDERHRRRMAMRNPRKLWKRSCMKCGKEIETTYAPDRPKTVYCEECYLKAVY